MKVLVLSGSRADFGGIEATYNALIAYGIDADLANYDGSFDYDSDCDLVVLCGDRFEILRAAVEFYIAKIPIAHLSGGDLTEGSQDDSMRHAITKLSHLHFPTNEESAKRIVQMGEDPERVHVVGYPGVDSIGELLSREEVLKKLGFVNADGFATIEKLMLVVLHPNTLGDTESEVKILSEALMKMPNYGSNPIGIVIIGPNADAGSDIIRQEWHNFIEKRKKAREDALTESQSYHMTVEWRNAFITFEVYHKNLSRDFYLSIMKHCDVMVGNSSSGFYEAPSFGTPVVNVGDRQKGRVESRSNFHLNSKVELLDIENCIRLASSYEAKMSMRDMPKVKNVYETGNAAEKIAEVISKIKDPKKLLHKKFHEIKY